MSHVKSIAAGSPKDAIKSLLANNLALLSIGNYIVINNSSN